MCRCWRLTTKQHNKNLGDNRNTPLGDGRNIPYGVFSFHVLDFPSKSPPHPENNSKLTFIVDSVLNKPTSKHFEPGEKFLDGFVSLLK